MRAALIAHLRRHWLLWVYVGGVVLVGFQFGGRGVANNLKIFRWSFFHLLGGQDVYQSYPELYYDVFKYSPSWALLFGPFALPPMTVGFFLWDLCSAVLLYYAVERLLPAPQARLALGIAFFEFMAAMQHASSSNTLVAGLIILAFVALEEQRPTLAALSIATAALMKIYPLAALTFPLLRRGRLRFAVLFAAVFAGLIVLPLLLTPPSVLIAQWRSWGRVLQEDTLVRGWSLMQLISQWFGVDWPNWPVQLMGTVILLLPLALRRDRWSEPHFRRLFLCSVLLYCLVFNHQAERPSFVVGYSGIAIWYAMSPRTTVRTALMALAFIAGPVLYSDVVPWRIRGDILSPLHVITIPCVLLWVVMQVELLGGKSSADHDRPPAPLPATATPG